jgi:integrase/recombinase XerD
MNWQNYISGFKAFLMLEKGLSHHSIEAYVSDTEKLMTWVENTSPSMNPGEMRYSDLARFLTYLHDLGLGRSSQARIISGIRSFFKFLLLEGLIDDDPSELLEGPRQKRTIPDVLTAGEIESILDAVDLSHPQGQRNRAMLETLYACGLRVSELVGLRLSQYYPELGFIRVIGKNNKERIVPIGKMAIKHIEFYLDHSRNQLKNIHQEDTDILFLNRRGRRLSRVMVFNLIKQFTATAGVEKQVSPHTFRHSFATHLIEGGADLKAVQDLLGHESITTTEIYTHLDTRYLRDTILKYHPRNRS